MSWDDNPYSSPEKYGMEVVATIDFSDGCYCFDYTVVFKHGDTFLYAEDAGCSCPSPFESLEVSELLPIGSLSEFQAHLEERREEAYYDSVKERVAGEIAELLGRLREAGAQ